MRTCWCKAIANHQASVKKKKDRSLHCLPTTNLFTHGIHFCWFEIIRHIKSAKDREGETFNLFTVLTKCS